MKYIELLKEIELGGVTHKPNTGVRFVTDVIADELVKQKKAKIVSDGPPDPN